MALAKEIAEDWYLTMIGKSRAGEEVTVHYKDDWTQRNGGLKKVGTGVDEVADITTILNVSGMAKLTTAVKTAITISKKKIPEHQKNVIFEITAEDTTEEDVEIPYVMLKLE